MKRLMYACLTVLLVVLLCAPGLSQAETVQMPLKVSIELSNNVFTGPQDITVTVKVTNPTETDMPGPVTLYYPDGKIIEEFGSPTLAAGQSKSWTGSWSVTQAQLERGRITFAIIQVMYDENNQPFNYQKNYGKALIYNGAEAAKSGDFEYRVLSDGTVEITGYTGKETNLTLPSVLGGYRVTGIGGQAFAYCSSLKSVTITSNVTYIDFAAFQFCSGLSTIIVPNSVTYIGSGAFCGCTSLEGITIPEGVVEIGDNTFNGCSSLRSIRIASSVMRIGVSAFRDCGMLLSVAIPDGMTNIGNGAFVACSNLRYIMIPASVASIGQEAFAKCPSVKFAVFRNSYAEIYARENRIPYVYTDVNALADSADYKYIGLSDGSIEITGYIGEASHLDIPEIIDGRYVTSIREQAFYTSDDLYSVTIPRSVTNIGKFAFCSSDITSITIPNSVTNIGEYAFSCSNLSSVVIPDSITSIGEGVFYYCMNLSSITIPSSVTSIAPDAFASCPLLTLSIIPNSYAETYAKENNLRYVSVLQPTPIPTKRPTPTPTPRPTPTATPKPDYRYSVLSSGMIEITDYMGSASELSIPSTIDGYLVIGIGAGAFYGSSLNNITLPEGVTSIGEDAFHGCSSLSSIELPESITAIGESAFDGCSSLNSIELPEGITTIGAEAFYGCSSLSSIRLPETVTAIGTDAFYGCDSLALIVLRDSYAANYAVANMLPHAYPVGANDADYQYTRLADGTVEIQRYVGSASVLEIPAMLNGYHVTGIGESAFASCQTLSSVTIPEGVRYIDKEAFYFCSALNSVTMPSTVTDIGDAAFTWCTALSSITIPSSVTDIGDRAFDFCDTLTFRVLRDSYAETYVQARQLSFIYADLVP